MITFHNDKIESCKVGGFNAYIEMISYDDYNRIELASIVGSNNVISSINQMLNTLEDSKYSVKLSINNDFRDYYFVTRKHDIRLNKVGDNLSQLMVKTESRKEDDLLILSCISGKEEDLPQLFYNKLYEVSDVPMITEWKDFIYDSLDDKQFFTNLTTRLYGKYLANNEYYGKSLRVTQGTLMDLISEGLKTNFISISDNFNTTEEFDNIEGLDDYLKLFSENIAKQIEGSFTPKFLPGVDKYSNLLKEYDMNCFDNGIRLFDKQKEVIQAASNNLDKNDITFVIGEMGTGKTLMGAGIPYVHSKGKPTNTIVMCPSHLVEKWKREIDRLVPNSETYILDDYTDVIELEDKIRDNKKSKSLYMIVSKDKAKSNYDKRPVAIWNNHKQHFVCPVCGQVLRKKEKGIVSNLECTDFTKENKTNEKCTNKIKKWNQEKGSYEDVICNTKLWATLNKDDEDLKWYKLGSGGWIPEDSIQKVINLLSNKPSKTNAEEELLRRVLVLKVDLENGKEVNRYFRASKKYSISTYIKKFLKGKIDYLIADELHLLKGESLQGESFDDFIKSSKKTIGLTGTLLNGYADSIFYILYRTLPRTMLKDGFKYNEVNKFIEKYGVMEVKSSSKNKVVKKKLPGVSPVVFTKFLLENSVFASLSDMSEGLPDYTEIPIGVDMSSDLKLAYEDLEKSFRDNVRMFKGRNLMSNYLQLLSIYPDTPYGNPAIYNNQTKEQVFKPKDIVKEFNYDIYKDDNKLQRYLDIVKEKVDEGEKVLTYISWTNKSDSAEKLKKALKREGINAEILRNVAPDKREEWIDKKVEDGMEVMICNPILVETGLDLLDFTTIIFYQIGYNIFTMRQASRRSWRLSQTKDIEVYFLYYRDTIQEQSLSLMANKLKASMAIEGKFSEEGLRAMSDNTDLMSEVANSVVKGLKNRVEEDSFSTTQTIKNEERITKYKRKRLSFVKERLFAGSHQKKSASRKSLEDLMENPLQLVNWY